MRGPAAGRPLGCVREASFLPRGWWRAKGVASCHPAAGLGTLKDVANHVPVPDVQPAAFEGALHREAALHRGVHLEGEGGFDAAVGRVVHLGALKGESA